MGKYASLLKSGMNFGHKKKYITCHKFAFFSVHSKILNFFKLCKKYNKKLCCVTRHLNKELLVCMGMKLRTQPQYMVAHLHNLIISNGLSNIHDFTLSGCSISNKKYLCLGLWTHWHMFHNLVLPVSMDKL
jgi:hypothetical protein